MTGFKMLLSNKGAQEMEMPEPMPPQICLDSKQFPDVKNWELGKEYTLKARLKSRVEDEDGHVHGDLEVVAAEGEEMQKKPTKGKPADEQEPDDNAVEEEEEYVANP